MLGSLLMSSSALSRRSARHRLPRSQSCVGWVLVALAVAWSAELAAENRIRVANQEIGIAASGQRVEVTADADEDVYGFSVSFDYDPTMLTLDTVEPGSDVARLEPEFSSGRIDIESGEVAWGVVFSLSAEGVDKHLVAGEQISILELSFTVDSTEEGETVLDLVDGEGPGRSNLLTDSQGETMEPAPALDDGILRLRSLLPRIEGVFPATGVEGTQVLVSGANFARGELTVRLCGQDVPFETIGIDSGTVRLDAPPCAVAGPADLEICNGVGCTLAVGAFSYDEPSGGTRFIRGEVNGDANVDLSDAVAIFRDLFLGGIAPAPCRDALDCNDSGNIDLTDGIYLLNGLFQGGPPPPAPFPEPGMDPTADTLPEC